MAWAGWLNAAWRAGCLPEAVRFRRATRQVAAAQQRLLLKMLSAIAPANSADVMHFTGYDPWTISAPRCRWLAPRISRGTSTESRRGPTTCSRLNRSCCSNRRAARPAARSSSRIRIRCAGNFSALSPLGLPGSFTNIRRPCVAGRTGPFPPQYPVANRWAACRSASTTTVLTSVDSHDGPYSGCLSRRARILDPIWRNSVGRRC